MIELRHSLLDPAFVNNIAKDAHKLANELKITEYHLTPTSIVFQLVQDEKAFLSIRLIFFFSLTVFQTT